MGTRIRWTLYGIGMILCGLLPFARMFMPFWDAFVRGSYGFFIGTMYISTGAFWLVYLFVMSAPFVIYGIVCIVQAQRKTVQTHTLAQSISRKTVTLAMLFGVAVGIAMACYTYTITLLESSSKYPLDTFCGHLGGAVFYILAVVVLIFYAHARRRSFVKKGFIFEIGVAFFGVLVGAWMLSALYEPIRLWEDTHGYVNTFVEWVQSR